MKMNRRNALLGLGAIATGGGALFGSGAFSQVEADRTVSITATGDGSALLALKNGTGATGIVGKTDASGSTEQVVEFSASSLNEDAVTTWNAALQVVNNGQDQVNFKVVSQSNLGSASSDELDFINNATGSSVVGSTVTLSASGGSVMLDIEVDLRGSNDAGQIPGTVTFQAKK